MDRIRKVVKQTDNRFLNMYELEVAHRDGKTSPYYMASRMENPAKIRTIRMRFMSKYNFLTKLSIQNI